MDSTKQLAEELARLPAQAAAAVRIIQAVQDPKASVASLARLIELDPVLSARVLRLANAPYHGLARRVSSPSRAVVLLGLSTVRAIAVAAASSVLADDHWNGPPGLWAHAVAVAAASSVVARHVPCVPQGDAFSAGLLHDLGTGLLLRRGSNRHLALLLSADPVPPEALDRVERDEFGLTHAQVGAQVFEAWRFPPQLVRAVAGHHEDPDRVVDPLTRVVVAGEAFAIAAQPGVTSEAGRDLDEVAAAVGLSSVLIPKLARELRRELESCDTLLRAGR